MFLGALAGAVGGGMAMVARMGGLASGARILSVAAMIAAGVLLMPPRNSLVNIKRRGRLAKAAGRLPTGVLNPIMAAGAMVLSSLSVIGNSRRL
jgi:cation transport ATPase